MPFSTLLLTAYPSGSRMSVDEVSLQFREAFLHCLWAPVLWAWAPALPVASLRVILDLSAFLWGRPFPFCWTLSGCSQTGDPGPSALGFLNDFFDSFRLPGFCHLASRFLFGGARSPGMLPQCSSPSSLSLLLSFFLEVPCLLPLPPPRLVCSCFRFQARLHSMAICFFVSPCA